MLDDEIINCEGMMKVGKFGLFVSVVLCMIGGSLMAWGAIELIEFLTEVN